MFCCLAEKRRGEFRLPPKMICNPIYEPSQYDMVHSDCTPPPEANADEALYTEIPTAIRHECRSAAVVLGPSAKYENVKHDVVTSMVNVTGAPKGTLNDGGSTVLHGLTAKYENVEPSTSTENVYNNPDGISYRGNVLSASQAIGEEAYTIMYPATICNMYLQPQASEMPSDGFTAITETGEI